MKLQPAGVRLCLGVLLVGVAAGCYPGEIETASQTDLVATFHKQDANFLANRTLAMPDTVIDISVAAGGSSSLDHTHDAAVLAQVQQQFVDLGYQFVDPAVTKPDAVVLVSAITVDNYSVWYGYPWWPYWGWYGGWSSYGYGAGSTWYYPWYPVVSSYTSGSVFIQLVDPDVAPPAQGQAVSIWGAAINGLLTGTNTEIAQRLTVNIAQAFLQSPYLRTQ